MATAWRLAYRRAPRLLAVNGGGTTRKWRRKPLESLKTDSDMAVGWSAIAQREPMGQTSFQAKPRPKSDEPHAPQRRMPVPSDDDVIVDRDAERLGDGDNVQCHLDVLGRGRRIARRVIVNDAITMS